MLTEEVMIYHIYHSLQHIKSDLDDITTDRIKSIEYTVKNMLKSIEEYYDRKLSCC